MSSALTLSSHSTLHPAFNATHSTPTRGRLRKGDTSRTSVACKQCASFRLKCSGDYPSCKRCKRKDKECAYDIERLERERSKAAASSQARRARRMAIIRLRRAQDSTKDVPAASSIPATNPRTAASTPVLISDVSDACKYSAAPLPARPSRQMSHSPGSAIPVVEPDEDTFDYRMSVRFSEFIRARLSTAPGRFCLSGPVLSLDLPVLKRNFKPSSPKRDGTLIADLARALPPSPPNWWKFRSISLAPRRLSDTPAPRRSLPNIQRQTLSSTTATTLSKSFSLRRKTARTPTRWSGISRTEMPSSLSWSPDSDVVEISPNTFYRAQAQAESLGIRKKKRMGTFGLPLQVYIPSLADGESASTQSLHPLEQVEEHRPPTRDLSLDLPYSTSNLAVCAASTLLQIIDSVSHLINADTHEGNKLPPIIIGSTDCFDAPDTIPALPSLRSLGLLDLCPPADRTIFSSDESDSSPPSLSRTSTDSTSTTPFPHTPSPSLSHSEPNKYSPSAGSSARPSRVSEFGKFKNAISRAQTVALRLDPLPRV